MKLNDLDGGTPYIADLGQTPNHGENAVIGTSQAVGEEDSGGFCGTPLPSKGSPWGDFGGIIRQHLGSKVPGYQPNPIMTTYATGEE